MNRLIRIFSLFAGVLLLTGCEEWMKGSQKFEIKDAIPSDSPLLTAEGGSATVSFFTDQEWSANSSEKWLTVSPTSGSAGVCNIILKSEANTSEATRMAVVTITAGSQKGTLNITQQGKQKEPTTGENEGLGEDDDKIRI